MAKRRLIERYILRTIFPYGVAALLLLTAILFVQQTGRYFETVFHGVMPAEFVYGLALASSHRSYFHYSHGGPLRNHHRARPHEQRQ